MKIFNPQPTSMGKEPLKDKVFLFTGDMAVDRDDAKMQVVMLGGRCTTVPSSKTTFSCWR